MADYTPIDDGLYSRYELAIMRRRPLRLVWRDPAGLMHLGVVTPLDLQTRAHAEYLYCRQSDGRMLEIRLDWITRVAFME